MDFCHCKNTADKHTGDGSLITHWAAGFTLRLASTCRSDDDMHCYHGINLNLSHGWPQICKQHYPQIIDPFKVQE